MLCFIIIIIIIIIISVVVVVVVVVAVVDNLHLFMRRLTFDLFAFVFCVGELFMVVVADVLVIDLEPFLLTEIIVLVSMISVWFRSATVKGTRTTTENTYNS